MTSPLQASLIFLTRIRHCAGYGVQSPTDYAFVREVIYERGEYSLYRDLLKPFPQAGFMDRKLAKLLLRVSNYAQADSIAVQGSLSPLMQKALQLGCRKSVIRQYSGDSDTASLIVCPDITHKGKAEWRKLLARPHIIAYDLHYIGFAFLDTSRYSECHIVNLY